MLDNSIPYTNKKPRLSDTLLPTTSHKTSYPMESEYSIQKSPQIFMRTPKKSSQLSDARRSINECLEIVSEKRRTYNEAIDEVNHVNNEILGTFSSINPNKSYFAPDVKNRTAENTKKNQLRDYVNTSLFQLPNQPNASQHSESELKTENIELKSRLNDEMRHNNSLLKKIEYLETENSRLGQNSSQKILEDNQNQQNKLNYGANIPYNIIQEMEKLKSENQRLRKDTIQLLQKQESA